MIVFRIAGPARAPGPFGAGLAATGARRPEHERHDRTSRPRAFPVSPPARGGPAPGPRGYGRGPRGCGPVPGELRAAPGPRGYGRGSRGCGPVPGELRAAPAPEGTAAAREGAARSPESSAPAPAPEGTAAAREGAARPPESSAPAPAPETIPAPPAPAPPVPAPAPPVPAVPAPAPVAAAGGTAPPHAESSFFSRVKRVFNFETGVYPEVAGNPQATLEAIVVVALATLFFGSIWSLFVFFITVPLALMLTAVSAGLVTLSARLFNKESPGFAPWFRALAFAQAPLSLGVIPFVGSFIAMVYCIATSVAAIHRVARLPVGVAILTWVIAWLLPLAFLLFLAFVFGGLAFMGSMMGSMA